MKLKKKKQAPKHDLAIAEKQVKESLELINKLIKNIRENKFEIQQQLEESEYQRKQLHNVTMQLDEKIE